MYRYLMSCLSQGASPCVKTGYLNSYPALCASSSPTCLTSLAPETLLPLCFANNSSLPRCRAERPLTQPLLTIQPAQKKTQSLNCVSKISDVFLVVVTHPLLMLLIFIPEVMLLAGLQPRTARKDTGRAIRWRHHRRPRRRRHLKTGVSSIPERVRRGMWCHHHRMCEGSAVLQRRPGMW